MSDAPFETIRRTVPADRTDYGGRMSESRYGQLFFGAADAVLSRIGIDAPRETRGKRTRTVEAT